MMTLLLLWATFWRVTLSTSTKSGSKRCRIKCVNVGGNYVGSLKLTASPFWLWAYQSSPFMPSSSETYVLSLPFRTHEVPFGVWQRHTRFARTCNIKLSAWLQFTSRLSPIFLHLTTRLFGLNLTKCHQCFFPKFYQSNVDVFASGQDPQAQAFAC